MTILVTGASGNVGSALLPLLADRGVPARVLRRDDAIDAQLEGVNAVFLACANVPEQVEFETSVINAAAHSGVRRIVKLSARGALRGSPVAFWDWHAAIEQHLADSGIPATVLRPSFLMTNLLAGADQVRHQGVLVAPAGEGRVSMIDPADVAGVAAAALTDDGEESSVLTLTGPESLSWYDVAERLSSAVGRQVGYVDVPPEAALASMVEHGLPEFVATQIVNVFAALRAGAQEETTGVVAGMTWRPGRTLGEFVRTHAEAFAHLEPVSR